MTQKKATPKAPRICIVRLSQEVDLEKYVNDFEAAGSYRLKQIEWTGDTTLLIVFELRDS